MFFWRKNNLLIENVPSKKFAEYMKKHPELYKTLANIVLKNISKSNVKSLIVDLGSGPGFLSIEIQKLIPNICIIDLDPSIKMLEMARKHTFKGNYKNFGAILAVSENIPLKSDSVDNLVSRFSLPYWKKPKDSFEEIFRVLKPGGRIILEVLNREFPRWKLILIKLHMFIKLAEKDVVRYHIDAYRFAYTIKQVEGFLNDAKFLIIKKDGSKKDWKFIVIAEKP